MNEIQSSLYPKYAEISILILSVLFLLDKNITTLHIQCTDLVNYTRIPNIQKATGK